MSSNNEESKRKGSGGFMGFLRNSLKGKDKRDPHIFGEYDGKLLFVDFDLNENKNKHLIMINHNGLLTEYHFNKKKSAANISPVVSVQWVWYNCIIYYFIK